MASQIKPLVQVMRPGRICQANAAPEHQIAGSRPIYSTQARGRGRFGWSDTRARGTWSGRQPHTMSAMEGSIPETSARSWLRCYRCWSQDLEVQVHYEGIHKIDPQTGERAEVVDELQEAVVQCLDCMHDQPHLGFNNGRVEPIEDRWERMIAGTPWGASCTVAVDAEDVETCSGPEAGDALSYAAFGDHGVREFFTHVRFHKHEDDTSIVVHLLVELYARSLEEATEVLE